MCGRFTLAELDAQRLALELGVPADQLADHRPRYNIAPTDEHWIMRMKREDREAVRAKWGLVQFGSKDAKRAAAQINARAETVAIRPAFRGAWQRGNRCVVPADGFFEWMGPKSDRQPLWFHRPDGGLIYFAGLYDNWRPTPDTWQTTFTIVTTEPNGLVEPIHDRMPVVLSDDVVDEWIFEGNASDQVQRLLCPAPDDLLVATPVSKRVNSVKNDDPECLAPA